MSILDSLSYNGGGRILNVELSEDKKAIELREACDEYFCTDLNKTDFGLLIDELKTLHEQMI